MASYHTTTQLQLTRNYLDGDIKGQFASKAIIHPEYQPEVSVFESPHGTYLEGLRANPGGDGFMRLGDIKGEFAPSRQVDRDPGDNFHGNAAGDPLPTEEIISNHGNRTNWDVICDIGTSIKQTSVADALTNGGTEGYTEVEWTYLKGDVWTNGSATSIRDGVTGSGFHDGLANGVVHPDMPMDTHPNDNLLGFPGSGADDLTNHRPEGFSEVEIHFAFPQVDQPSKFELDKSSTKYNPGNDTIHMQSGANSFNCDDILLGHGVTGFSTENLDSRLINHDDFLLVNNGGSTESVNGTIGYEMQAGLVCPNETPVLW